MKKPNNEKILRYSYKIILLLCVLSFIWLFLYIKNNVYGAIYAEDELISARSQISKEELSVSDLEEIYTKLKNRSKQKKIIGAKDIFN